MSTTPTPSAAVLTLNSATTFVRPCHLDDPSLLHQSTIAALFSILLNIFPVVAMAIECCASGVKAGAKLFRKRVIGSWRIRVVSKSEAIGMTLNNRIYFVIVTILEFVGLLILLNYVAALPL
jgi:hypothetical protein